MVEHGKDQGDLVVALMAGNGFHNVACRQDHGGRDRVGSSAERHRLQCYPKAFATWSRALNSQ